MPSEVEILFPPAPLGVRNTVATIADLRALDSTEVDASTEVLVPSVGFFSFSPSSLAVDNGTTILKPDDLTVLQAGRWLIAFTATASSTASSGPSNVQADIDGIRTDVSDAEADIVELQGEIALIPGAGFRDVPDAAFAFVGMSPRVEGPGQVEISETVEARFRRINAAAINGNTVYVAGAVAGASDSNDGSKPVSQGGGVGPYATLSKAVTESTASNVVVDGTNSATSPLELANYDWNNSLANAAVAKIVTFYGNVRIKEPGRAASALTFTLNTGATYSAPLAAAWATSTAYVVGDLRLANNQVWICNLAGTSAGSGTGPSGSTPGVNVTDGTTRWQIATPVVAVLWSGRQIDGRDRPLTRQTSVANVQSNDLSWCVVNGSLSVRIGTIDIDTIKANLTIIYSFDAQVAGTSYIQHRGVAGLWVIGEGSRVTCLGLTPSVTDRVGVEGTFDIDAGDKSDPRLWLEYAGSYGLDADDSNSAYTGVFVYSSKADALHSTGNSEVVEVSNKVRRAGSTLTWGQWTASLNGSAAHDGTNIARFDADYGLCAGPIIADSGTGKSWNVGPFAFSPTETGNGYVFYTINTRVAWIDMGHALGGADGDIHAETGTVIHLYGTTGLTRNGGGTINTYTPVNL